MLFQLLTPFILVAVVVVRAASVFNFPNVIPRAEIPVGITVHEYNDTAAALGPAAAPKLESFGSLKEGSDCNGSPVCKYLVDEDNCITAALVRYGKETRKHICPRGNSLSQLFYVDWLTLFLVIQFGVA